MGNVLSPFSDFSLQGGYPQGTDPETYGTIPPAPEGFYVSNTIGNDSNDGLSPSTPFLTIEKASQMASTPGDIVNIMAGTYQESSSAPGYPGLDFSVSALYSGTLADPIIFRAHLGDEGLAIIDSQDVRIGFNFNHNDYVHLLNMKIINNRSVGVHNWNSETGGTPAGRYFSARLADCTGALIAGNYIDATDGQASGNTASIRMDNSIDTVIRNNYLGTVSEVGVINGSHTSGIESYHTKNMLIENNHIAGGNSAVLIKDHWLEDNDDALFETEIRYNLITDTNQGVAPITGNSEPAGSNYVHHNVFNVVSRPLTIGSIAAESGLPGGYCRFENNTCVMTSVSANSSAITTDVGTTLTMIGNIILDYNHSMIKAVDTPAGRTDIMKITDLDYNIYDDTRFAAVTRESNAAGINVQSFAAWQAVLITDDPITMGQDNPDPNSITSNSATLFNDYAGGDYTNKVGSPALGFLSGGTNAGAYELGTEIIGTTGGGAL